MLTNYDWIVIVFYFVFMFGMGFVFTGFNKSASDYFRGGGSMVWWLVGATAFMTQFSAWTFTGAAGKAYRDGWIVAVIFIGNGFGYLVNYAWSAARFRNLRLTTAIEAVRDRFGAGNEQVFTWLQVPISFIYAGIWLNGLALFASAAFDIDMSYTIWIVGAVVVVMSVTGGSWAVVASDFIQMLLLMSVAVVTMVMALNHPAVGGISGFVHRIPSSHWNWSENARWDIVWLWVIATFIGQIVKNNSLLESYRYMCAKDGRHARRGALLAAVLMFIGPIVWFVPPMAAAIIEPDLASVFPKLKNASEAAYIYIGAYAMPTGMLGLLLCGIFAATMSSMDSGLNRNAGIFVKNFYKPFFAKEASDLHLLTVGKMSSLVFGGVIILVAFFIKRMEGYDLFNLMTHFGALVTIPYTVPLILGMIVKRVPAWSAWSTVLVGFIFSLNLAGLSLGGRAVVEKFDVSIIGFDGLTDREALDLTFSISTFGNIIVCSLWFLATAAFHRYASPAYNARVDDFFARMTSPVDYEKEEGRSTDGRQGMVLASMCYIYGGFVALLGLVFPNTIGGRLCFFFCGGIMLTVGYLLHRSAKSYNKKQNVDDEEKKNAEAV